MKLDEVKTITDHALGTLSEELGRGKSDQLIRYLAMLGKFHRYSFGNVMLIAFQRPDATHVAGFTRWLQLGRHVKKGEKGIAIVAPMLIRPKPDQHDVPTPLAAGQAASSTPTERTNTMNDTHTAPSPIVGSSDDIHSLLADRGWIAIFWSYEDVLSVRPDLSRDQAWDVLASCRKYHDAEIGINWEVLKVVADDLFPEAPATA